MLRHPNRDAFEFSDGQQIPLGNMPAGLLLDVLLVPGAEELSAILKLERAAHDGEEEEKESLLGRLIIEN
jgi:hypothetical protein